jgi:hypothetical protein
VSSGTPPGCLRPGISEGPATHRSDGLGAILHHAAWGWNFRRSGRGGRRLCCDDRRGAEAYPWRSEVARRRSGCAAAVGSGIRPERDRRFDGAGRRFPSRGRAVLPDYGVRGRSRSAGTRSSHTSSPQTLSARVGGGVPSGFVSVLVSDHHRGHPSRGHERVRRLSADYGIRLVACGGRQYGAGSRCCMRRPGTLRTTAIADPRAGAEHDRGRRPSRCGSFAGWADLV